MLIVLSIKKIGYGPCAQCGALDTGASGLASSEYLRMNYS